MKVVRIMVALGTLVLAACGNGSIKSPDFSPVATLTGLEIQPAVIGQGNSMPVGTTLSYRAIAHYSMTVQPGATDASGNPITEELRSEDVTGIAAWSSSNSTVASVDKGVVTGKSPSATPVQITAALEDKSASVSVTVTDAVLASIEYVKPATVVRDPGDQYSALSGTVVPFEIYGRFTDSIVRKLDEGSFDIVWTSSDPAVASNPAGHNSFQASALGAAIIRGEVRNTAASPAFATATLTVKPVNAFCEREFRAPTASVSTAASAACPGCSVANPQFVIDGDLATAADMSIPLGLLMAANVSLTAADATNPLTLNKPTGFVISRDKGVLSAQLLPTLTLITQMCDVNGANCSDVQSFSAASETLHLELLGLVGNDAQYLVSTDPITQPANGLKLTFGGGLVSVLATLHVQSACATAVAQ